jgi:hypothetical protein
MRVTCWKLTYASEEYAASIYKVQEKVGKLLPGVETVIFIVSMAVTFFDILHKIYHKSACFWKYIAVPNIFIASVIPLQNFSRMVGFHYLQ